MAFSPTLFAQLMRPLFAAEFARATRQFPNPKPPRGLTEYDHFLAMCFGQLTYRESLRDIVACLNSKPRLLYHLGFRGRLTRTNLAYANRHRDWRAFQAVAQVLMRRAASLYAATPDPPALPQLVFALDSSIISLALNLFPWGYYFRSRQAALKLHLLLSLRGPLPAWAVLTAPNVADIRQAWQQGEAFRAHAFECACARHGIDYRLTKPNHPWTNGQVERMNRTLKEATVRTYHYQSHAQLREHLAAFLDAYNFAKRLKTLNGLTSYQFICSCWQKEPFRFKSNPHHFSPGLNI